jgi:hypothetical protein
MAVAATQVYSFTVTIPAQTDSTLPYVQDCSFPAASVVSIRWRVPPGPSGFMGFQITSDGSPVIPQGEANYIVADDDLAQWDVAGYQDSGSWQVTGYNTDSYDHSVYVDFLTVPPGGDVPAAPVSAAAAPVTAAEVLTPAPVTTADLIAGLTVQS